MNQIEVFNRNLFLQINAGNDAPAWLVQLAIVIAEYLIYLIPLLLVIMWLWGNSRRRSLVVKACLVTLLGVGVIQLIGMVWQHPRPFMIDLGHTWITHAPDSSFPSDHMTVFSSVGLTLLFDGVAGWGVITLLAGLCIAWARVYLGVHFPLDMAGAVVIAGLAYAALTPIWQRAGGSITDMLEKLYRRILSRPIAGGWIRH